MSEARDNIEIDAAHRKDMLEIMEEQKEAMAPNRLKHIQDTAQIASKTPPYDQHNFYLVLVKTNERDELRRPVDRVFVRLSCPTPGYNQDVYKYYRFSGELEYLWSIPRKYRYLEMLNNKLKYLYNKETKRLMSFILSMESGDLLKWVRKENGDKPDAVITVNKPKEA